MPTQPQAPPVLDEGDTDPDLMVGEPVDPDHGLDVDAFDEDPDEVA